MANSQPKFKEAPIKSPLGGLNKDLAAEDIPVGQWQEHNNFHAFDGRIEKYGGYAQFGTESPTGDPFIFGYDFAKLDGTRYFIVATKADIYLCDRTGALTNLATGFTGTNQNRWQAAVRNDKLYLTNGVDLIQVFDGVTVAALAGDGTMPLSAKYIINSVNHLVTAHIVEGDTSVTPQRVRHSDLDSDILWIPATNNEAGYQDVVEGGMIRGMANLGPNSFYVYTENAITQFNYLGRPLIYSKLRAITDIGLYAPYSLVSTNDTHFFLGQSRGLLGFFAFAGSGAPVNIGDKKVDSYIERSIKRTNPEDVYGFAHPNFPEVWWIYRNKNSAYFSDAIIFNWQDLAWSERIGFNLSMLAEFQTNTSLTWNDALFPWNAIVPDPNVSWNGLRGEAKFIVVGGN